LLSTVVFAGDADGNFIALDALTGRAFGTCRPVRQFTSLPSVISSIRNSSDDASSQAYARFVRQESTEHFPGLSNQGFPRSGWESVSR